MITTDPVPFADSTMSAFEVVTLITLSVKFIDESIVRLDTLTTPVPPGVRLRSAFELVVIMLSLNVRLSTVTGKATDVAPPTDNESNVDVPSTCRLPVVVRFSFPKLIAPLESVIDPLAVVRVPTVMVPVVVKFSLPKLMAPDESVIDPSSSKMLPAARHGPD